MRRLRTSLPPTPSTRRALPLWCAFLSLLVFGACSVLIDNELDGKPSETASVGGSSAVGGQGGAPACIDVGDCPAEDTICAVPSCNAGVCGVDHAAEGTACEEEGICDGAGNCVECLDQDDCDPGEVCSRNLCVPSSCTDGIQNAEETGIDCGGDDCPPCENGSPCLDDSDCQSFFCDTASGAGGSGGAGGIGGSGGAGGTGGSGGEGICAPCGGDGDCEPYSCDNGICNSSCMNESDCAISSWCSGSACVPTKALGETCSAAVECASTFCADGNCCDQACQGACQACDAPLAGTCTLDAQGSPGSPSCTPYVCDGQSGVCPASCSADGDCAANHYCDGTSCQPHKANGAACGASNECSSGHCVDGVCCNTACINACDACNVMGSVGVCTPKLDGTLGDPGCDPYLCNGAIVTCPNFCTITADCVAGHYCGNSQCQAYKPNGATCANSFECASSQCVDGYCCNSSCANSCEACNVSGNLGTCTTVPNGLAGSPSCTPYVCNGSSVTCPTSCTNNSDCTPGNFCDSNNQCAGLKANGGTCTVGSQCQSNNCVNGYCCNTSCANSCDACNLSGSEGTCTPVPDGSTGNPTCGVYLCNGSLATCPASCVTHADCSSGNYCNSANQCVAKKANGTTCSQGIECQSANCIDGYCCNNSCGASCDACNVSGLQGSCSPVAAGSSGTPSCAPYLCNGTNSNCPIACMTIADCAAGNYCNASNQCVLKKPLGALCGAAQECQSNQCVDGYCCNSACIGGCNACDISGSEGTCTVMAPGAQGEPSCTPYVCDGLFQTCPMTCASDANCANGYYCAGSTCVLKEPNGSTCSTPNECVSGNCVDGYCCNTACTGSCNACDINNGTCTVVPGGTAGEPTCSPYLCTGSSASCPNTCASDGNCVNNFYCNASSQCVAKKTAGSSCAAPNECLSGFCPAQDGVCCDNACTATCEACSAVKTGGIQGTCAFVSVGTDPDNDCATPGEQCDAGICACGTQAVPPGGSCPMACTGGCAGTTCIIDCNADQSCEFDTLVCPPGFACEVQCNGDQSCDGATITCPSLYACNVQCDCAPPDKECCQNAVVTCSTEGSCDLSCGTGLSACAGTTQNCGLNACTAGCALPMTITTNCGNSCGCTPC